jgi:VanZ family protein
MNGNQSSMESGRVTNIIKNVINFFIHDAINDRNYGTFHGVIRKLVGHFGLFLIDGLIVSWDIHYLLKTKWWIKIIVSLSFGLFVACLTEGIQLLVPGRAGSGIDILIDYSGYLIGSGIIFLIFLSIYRHKKE